MLAAMNKTGELGALIVAAFDEAAQSSSVPAEISWLATRAVLRTLRRNRRVSQLITPEIK
jgi:hypothetical protein